MLISGVLILTGISVAPYSKSLQNQLIQGSSRFTNITLANHIFHQLHSKQNNITSNLKIKLNLRYLRLCYYYLAFYRESAYCRAILIQQICPSVCLSVTFQYQMKTVQHIIIVFSPYGSPIILVLPASNIFTKFRRGHPLRGR